LLSFSFFGPFSFFVGAGVVSSALEVSPFFLYKGLVASVGAVSGLSYFLGLSFLSFLGLASFVASFFSSAVPFSAGFLGCSLPDGFSLSSVTGASFCSLGFLYLRSLFGLSVLAA
jgi:hypothetical protein